MLYNLGLYLSADHHVTFCLRGLSPLVKEKLAGNQNFNLIVEAEFTGNTNFDIALLHLPFGANDISNRISASQSTLVVMEIQSRHPLQLTPKEASWFQNVIYLHSEQLPSILKFFSKSQCHLLPIINNINFDLPYKKTGQIASVGVWQYKHNMPRVLKVLNNSDGKIHFKMFSERPPTLRELGFKGLQYFYHSLIRKRIVHAGLEWDAKKLYSGFDCLLHLPSEGNGTSIVVSDALSCGKLVILSPLPAYKIAYAKQRGVHFIDEVGNDLGDIIFSFDEKASGKIKDDYRKQYIRASVLKQWKDTLSK